MDPDELERLCDAAEAYLTTREDSDEMEAVIDKLFASGFSDQPQGIATARVYAAMMRSLEEVKALAKVRTGAYNFGQIADKALAQARGVKA